MAYKQYKVKKSDIIDRPTTVKNIAPVKGMFGKKRLEKLEKAIENRNRRIKRQVKALAGEYTPENYAKLARSGYLPAQIKADFSKISSIKDYNALMRILNADKTQEWKDARLKAMRNWMTKMVEKSIYVDKKIDPELFEKINSMSEKEILEFRKNNPEMIKDFFEWYVAPYIDGDARDYLWDSIRASLGMAPIENKQALFAL